MSYQDRVPVVAGQDLTGEQYQAVGIAGTIVGTPSLALGILQEAPASGEDASVAYQGRIKAKAGGAITAGNRLTVTTSGYVTAVGSNELGVGTALETVTSGSVFEGIFNFAGVQTEVISGHLA